MQLSMCGSCGAHRNSTAAQQHSTPCQSVAAPPCRRAIGADSPMGTSASLGAPAMTPTYGSASTTASARSSMKRSLVLSAGTRRHARMPLCSASSLQQAAAACTGNARAMHARDARQQRRRQQQGVVDVLLPRGRKMGTPHRAGTRAGAPSGKRGAPQHAATPKCSATQRTMQRVRSMRPPHAPAALPALQHCQALSAALQHCPCAALPAAHLYSMSISSSVSMCSLTKLMGTASSERQPAAPSDLRARMRPARERTRSEREARVRRTQPVHAGGRAAPART